MYANGITRFGLRGTDIKRVGIPLPPLPEQRKIAAILSSVDDAIEKTQAVIDQVQVVKRGLMQELLTRGLPGRQHAVQADRDWGDSGGVAGRSDWCIGSRLADCRSHLCLLFIYPRAPNLNNLLSASTMPA